MSIVKLIASNLRLCIVILIALVVGGLTTTLVFASIPDSSGVIHGCYSNNNGSLKVIDTNAGQTCSSRETVLNWSTGAGNAAGGAIAVYDANNQLLGNLVDNDPSSSSVTVYNTSLNRLVSLFQNSNGTNNYVEGEGQTAVFFQSTDCSGQAYDISTDPFALTALIRWNTQYDATPVYGVVPNGTSSSALTMNSELDNTNGLGANGGYVCYPVNALSANFFPITTVSSPYGGSVVAPLHF